MRIVLCHGTKNSPHKKNHADNRMITEIFFQTKDSYEKMEEDIKVNDKLDYEKIERQE